MSAGDSSSNLETTGVVSFSILLNGSEASSLYSVYSLVVCKEVNKVAWARVVIRDGNVAQQDFEATNTDDFIPGTEIEIQAGRKQDNTAVFKGIITNMGIKIREGASSTLTVECRDLAAKLTVGRKSNYYHEMKDSEVIEEILGTYDVTPEVEATEVAHKELVQYNATDWDFIVARAEVNSQLVFVDDGTLTVAKPDTSQDALVTLAYGVDIVEFEAATEARQQYAAAKANSWAPADQAMVEEEGAPPSLNEQGNITSDDLAGVLGVESFDLIGKGELLPEEMKAFADARLQKSGLARIIGRVRFKGQAEVKPNTVVELAGVGDRFNGMAYVTAIRHEIAGGDWFTEAQFGLSPQWYAEQKQISAPPAMGMLPAVSGLNIGIVTQLEGDPDSEERVKIKIPAINPDDDGMWARIATLDAGENRGSFFRPEIDDEVLVGYLNDDPRYPVILGMLNSSAKPAPIAAADDNHEKGFVTRDELKLLFNDDLKSIAISTPNGNTVTLTDDEGAIMAEDENGNKIVMNADGILIESAKDLIMKASGDVTIEGTNISSAANAQYTAEGGAGAELSSGANVVVKGAIVQIN